jgi:hypothetical protein
MNVDLLVAGDVSAAESVCYTRAPMTLRYGFRSGVKFVRDALTIKLRTTILIQMQDGKADRKLL